MAMEFKKALELMKQGEKVKRQYWSGYWQLEDGEIKMYCKDGRVIDLRENEDTLFTVGNMLEDDWEVADRENSNLLAAEIIPTFSFGEALRHLKNGKAVRLQQWKEDVCIKAQYPDEHSKMTAPYLYVESRFGRVPWKETMIELFSEEWQLVE
jgi:hypothetical protein